VMVEKPRRSAARSGLRRMVRRVPVTWLFFAVSVGPPRRSRRRSGRRAAAAGRPDRGASRAGKIS
jgi:hypothetical protein